MKKLLILPLLSLLPFSFNAYAADFSCEISHGSLDCTEDRPIDYKAAGQGLRNILRWLDENSTNPQKKNIPANAYSYKNSWKCYDGYRKSGNSCIKQSYNSSNSSTYSGSSNNKVTNYNIPANAYRTKGTWKCLSGYVRSGNSCLKTNQTLPSQSKISGKCKIPENSYIVYEYSVDDCWWKCDYGYKKNGNSCFKEITIPEYGYASGNSFKCLNGYKKSGNACIKDTYIPDNAFASDSGWMCKAGYTKSNSSCIKSVDVPENGYAAGYTFLCFNGYKKIGSQCIKEQNEPLEDSSDYLEKIKQAKVLFDSGVITEDEFAEIKKRIIDNI